MTFCIFGNVTEITLFLKELVLYMCLITDDVNVNHLAKVARAGLLHYKGMISPSVNNKYFGGELLRLCETYFFLKVQSF
jgi:hypothetical protein